MSFRESSPENSIDASIRRIDEILGSGNKPLSTLELSEIQQEFGTPAYRPDSTDPVNEAMKQFYETYALRNKRRLKTQL